MKWIKKQLYRLFTFLASITEDKKNPAPYKVDFIGEAGGVKLYGFKNPLKLPALRNNALHLAISEAGLSVTKNDILKYKNLVEDYALKSDIKSILKAGGILEFYLDQHCYTKNIFKIASVLIMLEGEDPEKYDGDIIQAKQKLFNDNPEVKSFFLHMGYLWLMTFSRQSIGFLKAEDYLQTRQVKVSEQAFMKLLTQNIQLANKKVLT